ncbi:ABC transporter permease [Fictibacillus sp. b24]|uniref:ABC transporter permease n=1 Tax=Fictibacillus sp. b24 TaxID=3055863 RepID=UPI0025A070DE|nr:ABC transporter permease [Fictibacillus sp. b24]MDM5314880.1 ABC transporter permease [Fictibacillus sp. b24]
MKSALIILKEHLQNKYLISRLSLYDLKNTYSATMLGNIWVILNPLIQIFVYWLVFGLGIRGGAPVNGVPYFIWLISGIIPWFFISKAITNGSNSIYSKLNTVSKMNFPLSIVPTYTVTAQLYNHLILLMLLILTVIASIGLVSLNLFLVFYFTVAAIFLLVAIALITSTLSTLVRDVNILIQSIVRMLFYLTPIIWVPNLSELPYFFKVMFYLNPFYYLVNGYRELLLFGDTDTIISYNTLYYWNVVLVLFFIGAFLHVKFRKQFVDSL